MDFQRKLYGKVIATLKSKKILAKVKVIDFLLNLSYDRKIITLYRWGLVECGWILLSITTLTTCAM